MKLGLWTFGVLCGLNFGVLSAAAQTAGTPPLATGAPDPTNFSNAHWTGTFAHGVCKINGDAGVNFVRTSEVFALVLVPEPSANGTFNFQLPSGTVTIPQGVNTAFTQGFVGDDGMSIFPINREQAAEIEAGFKAEAGPASEPSSEVEWYTYATYHAVTGQDYLDANSTNDALTWLEYCNAHEVTNPNLDYQTLIKMF